LETNEQDEGSSEDSQGARFMKPSKTRPQILEKIEHTRKSSDIVDEEQEVAAHN
jgi:hypothetical protein